MKQKCSWPRKINEEGTGLQGIQGALGSTTKVRMSTGEAWACTTLLLNQWENTTILNNPLFGPQKMYF